jgi:hypothetical protein
MVLVSIASQNSQIVLQPCRHDGSDYGSTSLRAVPLAHATCVDLACQVMQKRTRRASQALGEFLPVFHLERAILRRGAAGGFIRPVAPYTVTGRST